MLKPFSKEGRFECGLDRFTEGKCWAFVGVMNEHGCWSLGVAVANEAGYNPIPVFWCNADTFTEISDHADALNAEEGLDHNAAWRIIASTMRPISQDRMASGDHQDD